MTWTEDRIQLGGTPNVNTGRQGCGTDFTFALTFEVNFALDIALDSEFTVAGCGSKPDPKFDPFEGWDNSITVAGLGTKKVMDCPPNPEVTLHFFSSYLFQRLIVS